MYYGVCISVFQYARKSLPQCCHGFTSELLSLTLLASLSINPLLFIQMTYPFVHPFSTAYPVRGGWGSWSLSQHLQAKAEYTLDKSPVHLKADI